MNMIESEEGFVIDIEGISVQEDKEIDNEFQKLLNKYIIRNSERMIFKYNNFNKLPDIFSSLDYVKILHIPNGLISSFDNLPPNLEELDMENNEIKEIEKDKLPKTLVKLNLSNNKIEKVQHLPENIQILNLSSNLIEICEVDDLPPKIVQLDIYNNLLRKIPATMTIKENRYNPFYNKDEEVEVEISGLQYCTHLDVSSNQIDKLQGLPPNLEILDCSKNQIQVIGTLPSTLKHLTAFRNNIRHIGKLPQQLEEIDVSNNNVVLIYELPQSLVDVSLNNNPQLEDFGKTTKNEFYDSVSDLNIRNTKIPIHKLQKFKNFNSESGQFKYDMPKEIEEKKEQIELPFRPIFPWEQEEKREPVFTRSFDIMSFIRKKEQYDNLIDSSRYNKSNPHYIILKKVVKL